VVNLRVRDIWRRWPDFSGGLAVLNLARRADGRAGIPSRWDQGGKVMEAVLVVAEGLDGGCG
jgi:hypothetical protein